MVNIGIIYQYHNCLALVYVLKTLNNIILEGFFTNYQNFDVDFFNIDFLKHMSTIKLIIADFLGFSGPAHCEDLMCRNSL